MKDRVLIVYAAALLLLGAAAITQAADSKADDGKSKATHSGCLAQGDEAKEFKLTHVDGGADEYELVGGKDLKGHVGHKVEVSGELLSGPEHAEDAKAGETGKKGTAKAGHRHLRVASMKHLAATCP